MTNKPLLSRRSATAALLLLAVFTPQARAVAAPSSPAAVVRAFYRDHFARSLCCFDEAGLRARRAWFTAALYERMLREVRRQTPADEAPYFNGDPFTNSQEGPVEFRVGRASARGGRAVVGVTLRFADGRRTVERRTLRVELVRQRGAWKIDNLRYQDGKDFVTQLDREVGGER